MHVARAMTDPASAAHALLDLGERPLLRVAGDRIRYRLAAATLLFGKVTGASRKARYKTC